MSKRKHSDIEALELANPSGTTSVKRQRKSLTTALENGKKQLHKAFKLARGFERQKLGRRQKSSKTKNGGQNMDRLQAEVTALKDLDLTLTAETYLCKQMIKTKAIAEHPALPDEVRKKSTQQPSKDVAHANVTARLYSSNPVTEAMDQVTGIVRRTLGLRQDDLKPKKRMRKADFEAATAARNEIGVKSKLNPNLEASREQDTFNDRKAKHRAESENDDEESFAGWSDHEGLEVSQPAAEFDSEDEDREADGLSKFDSRLADSSEDDDENDFSKFDSRLGSSSEDDSGDDAEARSLPKLYAQRLDRVASTADVGSPRSQFVSLSPSVSPEPHKRRATATSATKSTQSSFLPALATGYISGSDSEASEVSAIAEGPRKNRMGQRARQALWEQKYGSDARHIKKGANSQNRDSGWDSRRGATDGSRAKPWEKGRSNSHRERSAPRQRERPEKAQEQPEKVPTYGSAHPSWIAKQQAKEKAATAAKPAGKKITFD